MNARAFFDTNVLVYLYSIDEPEKRNLALKQVDAAENRWVSTQVLSELSNTLRRKFDQEYDVITRVIDEVIAPFQVMVIQPDTIRHALNLAQVYRYSYYDSLILAAALEQSCHFLYSEDMQHEQVIEQSLVILNPFKVNLRSDAHLG
jgi:predicted nucleic acid-binding protein